MPVIYKEKPYKFDINAGRQHHFGRCYISDYKKSYLILKTLHKHRRLKNSELPLYFPTPRAENWREHLIELWRTGLNIGILREGARSYSFVYLGDEEVPEINILKNFIDERRKYYPYTLFFLDELNSYPDGLTENQLIPKYFSQISHEKYNSGCLDQIHPTMNDLSKWEFIEGHKKRTISTLGKSIINEFNDRLVFICYSLDFSDDSIKNRLLWAILKIIQLKDSPVLPIYPFIQSNPPYIIEFKNILDLYNGIGKGKLKTLKDISLLTDIFNSCSIRYKIIDNANIEIFDRIFFSITPAAYVNSGLCNMDNIEKHVFNVPSKIKSEISVVKDNLNSNTEEQFPKYDFIIISSDPESSVNLFSDYTFLILDFKDWLNYKNKIAFNPPLSIIVDYNWSPTILEASCGNLLSYVKNGGLLIIHGIQGGRTGTNKQFFNWLPEDFERLSYLESSMKWTFDKNRLTDIPIEPIFCSSFKPSDLNNHISAFSAKYGVGSFLFIGDKPNKELYKSIYNKIKNVELKDFNKSFEWSIKDIPQLYRSEKIQKEEHTYPIIADILHNYFGFTMSETFCNGWKGDGSIKDYVDLFTTFPAITLWEIDSIKGHGITGDAVAIDQNHATKCDPYRRKAEYQFIKLLEILNNHSTKSLNDLKKNVREEVNRMQKVNNFQILEIFETYLNIFLESDYQLTINKFIEFIKLCNAPIENKPVISLIGSSYGFAEGIKSSAREYSKDLCYSLWTYRDIFEFLIKLKDFNKQDRLLTLLKLLNLRDGPVYLHISNI